MDEKSQLNELRVLARAKGYVLSSRGGVFRLLQEVAHASDFEEAQRMVRKMPDATEAEEVTP